MFFSPKTLSALTLAALLAGPALAQQTTTTTKTKTKRSAAKAAATPAAAPALPGGTLPPPPAPGEGRGPHGHGPHGGPRGEDGPRPDHALQPVQSLSGTVARYVTNPEGFYDGFVTTLSGTETTVHFPLHMAKAVMAAAKPGQTISFGAVAGRRGPHADRSAAAPTTARLELVSLQNGSTPLLMQRPERPNDADASASAATTAWAGRITELRRDDRGLVRGLVLADNTLLLLPPHVGTQLGDKLKVGETVQATGAPLTPREGMVAATDTRRVHAQTLTVGGVQYLVH
ncbi:hypothetical protein E5K00_13990 [Hymenobacter aquaticus]|uniref:DUF5666 domain-containing protein n=1 Tax=Hymenobacter aquaticus TaxID=1867101 RepID=A0A4Z0PVV5_9BACT|nr:hypothetical protein [Hymenobacter aquaticus]TGE21396.1 hypothetical protein E5K00_13990 [Hymenobacter aquaticus]